jgi:hypothetical protein
VSVCVEDGFEGVTERLIGGRALVESTP